MTTAVSIAQRIALDTWALRFLGGDGGTAEELADARIPAASFLCF